MTQTTDETLAPIEVQEFVARVRRLLADLDPEEQQELTAGLEADLGDLVAERGAEALGDPATYARELRVAAGHPAEMAGRPGGRSLRDAVMDGIDSTHASWDRLLDSLPGGPRGFLAALQPVWWVLRAAVAWLFVQDVRGPWVVVDGEWLVVLGLFVVVSVQMGRRTWGLDRLLSASVLARLLLLGLNVFAVCLAPGAADRVAWHIAEQRAYHFEGYYDLPEDRTNSNIIQYRDQQVCDLEVRDAQGGVLADATVWDVTGDRPLPMHNDEC